MEEASKNQLEEAFFQTGVGAHPFRLLGKREIKGQRRDWGAVYSHPGYPKGPFLPKDFRDAVRHKRDF